MQRIQISRDRSECYLIYIVLSTLSYLHCLLFMLVIAIIIIIEPNRKIVQIQVPVRI
jgi:hypothetical protein